MGARFSANTITFLFTDVEGRTTLWEAAEMGVALERHDALLRMAIESSAGKVVKTMGDGLVAVFADANGALAASLAAQRALQVKASDSANVMAAADAPTDVPPVTRQFIARISQLPTFPP